MLLPLVNSEKTVEVDDDIGLMLGRYVWRINNRGYVGRRHSYGFILMHRQIMWEELENRKGYVVEHWDGNKLNNRRKNLRVVKQGKNLLNQHRMRKDNVSGVTGVSWFGRGRAWKVYVGRRYVGSYKEKWRAEEVRKKEVEAMGGRHSKRGIEVALEL